MNTSRYTCVTKCKKSFTTQRGLTKHQDRCQIYFDVTDAELLEAVEIVETMERGRDKKRRRITVQSSNTVSSVSATPSHIGIYDEVPLQRSPQQHAGETPTEAISSAVAVEPAPIVEELGRGKRKKRRNPRYIDPQPQPPSPLPIPAAVISPYAEELPCRTRKNANGLFRIYFSRPSFVPDDLTIASNWVARNMTGNEDAPLDDEDFTPGNAIHLATRPPEISTGVSAVTRATNPSSSTDWFFPFINATCYRLMSWFWCRSELKSSADLQSLAEDVLQASDFRKEDLQNFNVRAENRRLDMWQQASPLSAADGWRQTSVDILLATRRKSSTLDDVPRFTIHGLHYRLVLEVIKIAFQSRDALSYHYMPFTQLWQRSESDAVERVYDELYTADMWRQQHLEIQRLPRSLEDNYERAIAALMLWSDSTHLTDFGNASLWPIYLFFGNQSKYDRCKPNAHACHHLAYLPKLPDSILDAFKSVSDGKLPTDATIAHCRRDMMHALLDVIFDEEFKHTQKTGIVVNCVDGITRRIYPRIFTYSADYPEKVLLSSIRSLSNCPCPRCLIKKTQCHSMGTADSEDVAINMYRTDTSQQQLDLIEARAAIYLDGRGVKSMPVEKRLAAKSLVPTLNTFSTVLGFIALNFYRLFVVDFMHEFELGLWKMTFVHLIRVLIACGQSQELTLNERYRAISTFGRDTIRRFTNDASSMKKLAARDYEDLLLCSMVVFDGLFPEDHNTVVQDLLFALLTWHALAKLRSHTDTTLELLLKAKRALGAELQHFEDTTCRAYETHELPAERAKRERTEARRYEKQLQKQQKLALQSQTQANQQQTELQVPLPSRRMPGLSRRAKYNRNTYKAHAPEHYIDDIRQFGTTDSYSTQIGEREHRHVKAIYARTNKNRATEQMTKIERREYLLRQIALNEPKTCRKPGPVKSSQADQIAFGHANEHHHISQSRRDSFYLSMWQRKHIYDPATKDFRRKLKDHLLMRLLNDEATEFTDTDRNSVIIEHDQLFEHKVFRVNYTTYDGRRKQDSVKPNSHADVMVLASCQSDIDHTIGAHPYRYARVLGIYHASVCHTGRLSNTDGVPQNMEFLWVRWFENVSTIQNGLSLKRMYAMSFVSERSLETPPFGFLDPNEVIRGAHLLPAFKHGRTSSLLRESVVRPPSDMNEDWCYFFVNSFVDRDMFLRYTGGGIGHTMLKLDKTASQVLNLNYGARADSRNGFARGDSNEDDGRIEDEEDDEMKSYEGEEGEESSDSQDDSALEEEEV